jgi:hypothetical protein
VIFLRCALYNGLGHPLSSISVVLEAYNSDAVMMEFPQICRTSLSCISYCIWHFGAEEHDLEVRLCGLHKQPHIKISVSGHLSLYSPSVPTSTFPVTYIYISFITFPKALLKQTISLLKWQQNFWRPCLTDRIWQVFLIRRQAALGHQYTEL